MRVRARVCGARACMCMHTCMHDELKYGKIHIIIVKVKVLIVGFGYVSVMISWLFSCPQLLGVLIVGFGYDVSVMISWSSSCPKQLSLKITFIV